MDNFYFEAVRNGHRSFYWYQSHSHYIDYLGNYWDDYNGIDSNDVGIGDLPYIFNDGQDNYPLILPFENFGLINWLQVRRELTFRAEGATLNKTIGTQFSGMQKTSVIIIRYDLLYNQSYHHLESIF